MTSPLESERGGSALIVGSINLDTRWSVPHLPVAGETVLSTGSRRGLGGKGTNQAVAISALDVPAALVAAVGNDEAAGWLLEQLAAGGVDTTAIVRMAGESGQAQVVVEDSGDNLIVVVPGSNAALTPEHVERALSASAAQVVVVQQEIPVETVAATLRGARLSGRTTILNAAPARPVDAAVLADVSVLVVNRGEATAMGGTDDLDTAVAALRRQGAAAVLVSLGADGALLDPGDHSSLVHVPSPRIGRVVDTTGAGDVMTGALAACLCRGWSLRDAVELAVRAASWSVRYDGVRAPTPADLPDSGL
jgi:ribokinase